MHSKTDQATASHQSVNIFSNLNPQISEFHHNDWGAGHAQDINTRPEKYREYFYGFLQKHVAGFGSCGE